MQKLIVLLTLAASAAFGSTIRLTALPQNSVYGTYNGYVQATIDGISGRSLICDDYYHTSYVPSGDMIFDLSTLTGPQPLEYVRFVQPGSQSNTLFVYEEAAVLLDGLNHNGPGSLMDLTADYQYALWHLFSPGVALPNTTAKTLLNEAALRVVQGGTSNDALYARLRIYTPTAAFASNQEFLGLISNPEPSPAILMVIGAAVMGLSVMLRRSLKKRQTAAVMLGSSLRGSAQ